MVSQKVHNTLHDCIDSPLKCNSGFGCTNAIKYSYPQGMPTYVSVHIEYFLTLRTKLTWHPTCKMTLTHRLKIRLLVSVLLVLPAKYFCSKGTFLRCLYTMVTRCIPHIYNRSPMTEDKGCILCGIHRSRHGSYDTYIPCTTMACN